ncbi:hypothetical protein SAMN02910409_0440 [Prevotellaceae bacterium HUN156]|nr:hypothetical protein SAMN02910409_0440 [Prevotellaceae bacterium HUN156]
MANTITIAVVKWHYWSANTNKKNKVHKFVDHKLVYRSNYPYKLLIMHGCIYSNIHKGFLYSNKEIRKNY